MPMISAKTAIFGLSLILAVSSSNLGGPNGPQREPVEESGWHDTIMKYSPWGPTPVNFLKVLYGPLYVTGLAVKSLLQDPIQDEPAGVPRPDAPRVEEEPSSKVEDAFQIRRDIPNSPQREQKPPVKRVRTVPDHWVRVHPTSVETPVGNSSPADVSPQVSPKDLPGQMEQTEKFCHMFQQQLKMSEYVVSDLDTVKNIIQGFVARYADLPPGIDDIECRMRLCGPGGYSTDVPKVMNGKDTTWAWVKRRKASLPDFGPRTRVVILPHLRGG